MAPAPGRSVFRTLGLVNGVIGAFLLFISLSQAYDQYHIVRSWTPITAEFLRADVIHDKNNKAQPSGRYTVTWTFRYRIKDALYESSTHAVENGSHQQMMAASNRFHPGDQVVIRYDPASAGHISLAAFDRDTFEKYIWAAVLGTFLLALGLVFLRRSFSS